MRRLPSPQSAATPALLYKDEPLSPAEDMQNRDGEYPFSVPQAVKKPLWVVWRAVALQMQSESGDMCGGFGSLAQQGFLALFPAREAHRAERETMQILGKGRRRRTFSTRRGTENTHSPSPRLAQNPPVPLCHHSKVDLLILAQSTVMSSPATPPSMACAISFSPTACGCSHASFPMASRSAASPPG